MFGRRRKDDEDPFAVLKDGGTYQSAPITVPAIGDAAAAPVAPQPPPPPATAESWTPPSGARVRRSGVGFGTQIGLRLAVAGVTAAVGVGVPLIAVHHASHPSTFSVPSFNFNPETTPNAPTAPPVQLSYLTTGALAAGLAHVERLAPGARLSLLRIDDHSLSATAVARDSGPKLIYFGPNGTFVTSTSSTGQVPVPISEIHPSVIRRLLAGMRARFHTPPAQIDYVVLSSPQGSSPSWVIFTKAPSHPGYLATLSGAGLHRIA